MTRTVISNMLLMTILPANQPFLIEKKEYPYPYPTHISRI